MGDHSTVMRWDGSALAVANAPAAERYLTVHGCGPSDVTIVGGSVTASAAHWDGTAWADATPTDAGPLAGVFCAGGTTWISGAYGYAARRAGTGAWTTVETPIDISTLTIHGLYATAAGRVLGAGGNLNASGSESRLGFALERTP